MNVRRKLGLLVFGTVFMCVVAASVYFLSVAPLDAIRGEMGSLTVLSSAEFNLRIQLNRLGGAFVDSQRPAFKDAVAAYDEAFAGLGRIVKLRRLDYSFAKALDVMTGLRELNKDALDAVDAAYARVVGDIDATFGYTEMLSPGRLYETPPPGAPKAALEAARKDLKALDFAVGTLDMNLESSTTVIALQGAAINAQVAAIKDRAVIFSLVIVAAIIAATMLSASALSRRIALNITGMAEGVRMLSEGDLSATFRSTSLDEIGLLATRLGLLTKNLNEMVRGIQEASERNALARDGLLDGNRRIAEAIGEAGSSIGAIDAESRRLRSSAEDSRASVAEIMAGVENLDRRISNQIAMVEESTASITQMIASIASMTRIAEKDGALASELVRDADSAREIFLSTFEKIEAIASAVGRIDAILSLIEDIAGKTNILALNAAIESAHAGEAGRGFAVVADEIGKLAAASSENAKEIGQSIEAIVAMIGAAKEGSGENARIFAQIDAKIREVSRSVGEIGGSLSESDEGGRQILVAMTELRVISVAVNAESHSMASGAGSIETSMLALDSVAGAVGGSMAEIAKRVSEIREASSGAAQMAEQMASVGSVLEEKIAAFRVAPA
jgi:methyl-accepting chemotaxis protein